MQARRLALDLGLVGTVAQSDVLLAEHALVHDGPNALPEFASRLTEHARLLAAPALRLAAEILLATGAALTGSDPGREPRVTLSGRDPWHDERAQLRAIPALAALAGHDHRAALDHLDVAMGPLLSHRSAAPFAYFGLWALLATCVRGADDQVRDDVSAHPAALRRLNQGALRFADAVAAGRGGDRAAADTAYREREPRCSPPRPGGNGS